MYKHLVVAVDGSETSLNALKHAAELASVNNARLSREIGRASCRERV